MNKIDFPVYRKYKNEHAYFKIHSAQAFDEIKKEAKHYQLYQFEAKILPDRNFINDMMFDYSQHWEEISAAEYEAMLALAKT